MHVRQHWRSGSQHGHTLSLSCASRRAWHLLPPRRSLSAWYPATSACACQCENAGHPITAAGAARLVSKACARFSTWMTRPGVDRARCETSVWGLDAPTLHADWPCSNLTCSKGRHVPDNASGGGESGQGPPAGAHAGTPSQQHVSDTHTHTLSPSLSSLARRNCRQVASTTLPHRPDIHRTTPLAPCCVDAVLDADPHPVTRPAALAQEVREAFLAQDALKAVVTLVAEPLSNHPEMSERVRSLQGSCAAVNLQNIAR